MVKAKIDKFQEYKWFGNYNTAKYYACFILLWLFFMWWLTAALRKLESSYPMSQFFLQQKEQSSLQSSSLQYH